MNARSASALRHPTDLEEEATCDEIDAIRELIPASAIRGLAER